MASLARRFSSRAVITEGNAVPSGTTPARSERAKRSPMLRSSSSLRLTERHWEDVGTIKELDDAIKGARRALRDFSKVTPPNMSTARAFYFGNCVCTFRFLLQWIPWACMPFSRSIVELGGLERAYLLIVIARFDLNRDGKISRQEFESARVQGEKCVSNAVTGCANFAVISALLFGGAHALTLGRPKPFAPDPSSVEAYGEEVTTVAIWCAYGLNVLAQSLALGIIITSIFMRQLLCNTLPSMISKLVFLLDTNTLSNLAMACTWLVICLLGVVVLGGFLSSPTYGLLSLLILPVLFAMVIPNVYPAFLKSALRLHAEANAALARTADEPPKQSPDGSPRRVHNVDVALAEAAGDAADDATLSQHQMNGVAHDPANHRKPSGGVEEEEEEGDAEAPMEDLDAGM